jgi:uroporphyrin-III C-methyltransferase / precorrin-2 dehydrogenase / sirohydrochlorin ferrochelatase
VGGGQVAARKMEVLLELPCAITIVAPQIAGRIDREVKTGSIRWMEREYILGDCNGFQLVIAATQVRETNRSVSDEAKRLGIPVNVVDDPALSTVIFPAVWRDKSLVIAVSTEGVAPFMASKIRTRLAFFVRQMGDWIEIAGKYRAVVRKEISDADDRKGFYNLFPYEGPPGEYDRPPEDGRLSDWLSWLENIHRKDAKNSK